MPKAPLSFGQALRAARKDRGLTMAALARAAGVQGLAVSRWERGDFMPSVAVRVNLVAALAGAPPDLLDLIRRELGVAPQAELLGRLDPSYARVAVDSAILAMGDVLGGVGSPVLRAAAAALLGRMRTLGLDVRQACDALG
jgi:transcriptional regulator with XRE-family HTH domain